MSYLRDYAAQDPFPYEVRPNAHISEFNPSGLVPYPCDHGIYVKPSRYKVTQGQRMAEDGELPPYGARSWGRAKYLIITAYGARNGVAFALPQCPECQGLPRPADMTTPADEAG